MAIHRAQQIATGVAGALTAGSLLVLALTGCSPAKAGAGGTSAPKTSATTPGAPPATGSAHGQLDGVPSACPSADLVMSKLHQTSLVVHGGDPSTCEYLFKGRKSAPHVLITFNANPGITAAGVKAGLKQGQKDVQTVPGVGDGAFSWATAAGKGLAFFSGDVVCSILAIRPTTTADEAALANAIIAG